MTTAEIYQMIQSVGIPAVYHHFEENTGQDPPFICFYYPYDNDVKADNRNYVPVNNLTIELYTDRKDFLLEKAVENILQEAGLVYSKTETYLSTEKMYMETFTTEVIIDGE